MTMANATNKDSGTAATASTQGISFTFNFFATSEILVDVQNDTTGVIATLTPTTHYTVGTLVGTGTPNYTGATVSITSAADTAYPAGNTFYIYRKTTQTQTLDLTENDDLPAQSLEQQMDKLFALWADANEQLSRCIKVPVSDGTVTGLTLDNQIDRASTTLGFDASGNVTLT
ncbi:unnamed protein product [marine sediment metagenome]|uniref:Uncharacterized protein n=1 Tax=marine sediment metagenome TaxID=412755 RepID=X1N779_9ZZZZ